MVSRHTVDAGTIYYDGVNKESIDITKPFIAIRVDVKGGDYEPTMGEYLCNPLDEDLLDAEVSTGGWYGADELGVIESIEKPKDPRFLVPAGKAVRFALSTWDEYCEMSLHWSVRYRTSEGVVTCAFETFKQLEDCVTLDEVPCLGGRGHVVP